MILLLSSWLLLLVHSSSSVSALYSSHKATRSIKKSSPCISLRGGAASAEGDTAKRISKRRLILNKIAILSRELLKSESPTLTVDAEHVDDGDEITAQSDLSLPNRKICIVTTAALPWMTGTSVNPLLRAAYMVRMTNEINAHNTRKEELPECWVTLLIPWLELPSDREILYGTSYNFTTSADQELYIRSWLTDQDLGDVAQTLNIQFYPARYHSGLCSIFAMGDMIQQCLPEGGDVCILEEPEHLNWYRAPTNQTDGYWTRKFNYVVGVVHTNYKKYAAEHYSGLWTSPMVGGLSSAMVRAYCHQVIKLSAVLQTYAPEKEVVSNVHGVRADFLREGKRRADDAEQSNASSRTAHSDDSTRTYFIGKILWAKGLDKMINLQNHYRQCTGEYFPIDIYGSGPEEEVIKRAYLGRNKKATEKTKKDQSRHRLNGQGEDDDDDDCDTVEEEGDLETILRNKIEQLSLTVKLKTEDYLTQLPKSRHEIIQRHPIPASFRGRVDHGTGMNHTQYKLFINPSESEVLCTTTAEALAMGKFAIIPVHASNDFFLKFPNCLPYRDKLDFAANIRWALTHDPEPLSPALAREFSWEAATERFVKACQITKREARYRASLGKSRLDERIAYFHNELGKGVKGDVMRKVLGGGPVSDQARYGMEKMMKEEGEEGVEDDDETLDKLEGSWLGSAIRKTFSRSEQL